MTIRNDRLHEAIRLIASEEILTYSQVREHTFGIITLLDIIISPDKSFIDLMVHGQGDDRALVQFLSGLGGTIHARISRELGLRKTPRIRFKKAKSQSDKKDILTLIRELDAQYGLSH